MTSTFIRGAACGIVAAALFGASAPVAKLLLPNAPPLLFAALLYLGAGIGMTAVSVVRGMRAGHVPTGKLTRQDLPLAIAIVITGGIVGPVLMLIGLGHVRGVVGAMLLNLEGPLTALLAVAFFGDALNGWESVAAMVIFAGAVLIGLSAGDAQGRWFGGLAIAAACLSWAIDNNLTQRLSLRDPLTIVRVKTLSAGACNLVLSLAIGQRLAAPGILLPIMALGFMSYGLSILLDVYALRLLGAAREAAFFATAPFLGVVLAVPLLGERLTARDLAAGLLMAIGVAMLLARQQQRAAEDR